MQLAFAYTYLPSLSDSDTIKRRLRLHTVQIDVVKQRMQLYEAADPQAIITLLTHKVLTFRIAFLHF